MLQSLLAYARGAGVDARWLTIGGNRDFFRVTKRIHNHLHGAPGDGGALGRRSARSTSETLLRKRHRADRDWSQDGIVVTSTTRRPPGSRHTSRRPGSASSGAVTSASTIPMNSPGRRGLSSQATWRRPTRTCSRGRRSPGRASTRRSSGWSRRRSTPSRRRTRSWTGSGSSDRGPARACGRMASGPPSFQRQDGTRARVDRRADLDQAGPIPPEAPLIVQVSRWDRLKDPVGRPQVLRRELQRPHGAPAARGPLGSRGCR